MEEQLFGFLNKHLLCQSYLLLNCYTDLQCLFHSTECWKYSTQIHGVLISKQLSFWWKDDTSFHSFKWEVCVYLPERSPNASLLVLARFWNGKLSSFSEMLPKVICPQFSWWKLLFLFFMIWINFQETWLVWRFIQIHPIWWWSCSLLAYFSFFFLVVVGTKFFLNFRNFTSCSHAKIKVLSGILDMFQAIIIS